MLKMFSSVTSCFRQVERCADLILKAIIDRPTLICYLHLLACVIVAIEEGLIMTWIVKLTTVHNRPKLSPWATAHFLLCFSFYVSALRFGWARTLTQSCLMNSKLFRDAGFDVEEQVLLENPLFWQNILPTHKQSTRSETTYGRCDHIMPRVHFPFFLYQTQSSAQCKLLCHIQQNYTTKQELWDLI